MFFGSLFLSAVEFVIIIVHPFDSFNIYRLFHNLLFEIFKEYINFYFTFKKEEEGILTRLNSSYIPKSELSCLKLSLLCLKLWDLIFCSSVCQVSKIICRSPNDWKSDPRIHHSIHTFLIIHILEQPHFRNFQIEEYLKFTKCYKPLFFASRKREFRNRKRVSFYVFPALETFGIILWT